MSSFGAGTITITVEQFLASVSPDLPLTIVCGATGIAVQELNSHRIQKFGLALSGFPNYIHQGRVQNIGQSEIAYLQQLSASERKSAFEKIDPKRVSCLLLTKSLEPPAELIEFADANFIPLLQTPLLSSRAISMITTHLERQLAPQTVIHGVLVEMHGIGVLINGQSGIGKSECALDLITRGHRLVADDAVFVRRIGGGLEGSAPELTFEHLELHGLGIISVRDLFGVSAVCKSINIELCIELQKWSEIANIERVGLEMLQHEIFGIGVPKFILPVSSGRNLATIVDTAVRIFLLRNAGYDAASKLIERHSAMVSAID